MPCLLWTDKIGLILQLRLALSFGEGCSIIQAVRWERSNPRLFVRFVLGGP